MRAHREGSIQEEQIVGAIKERLRADLTAAMKARDDFAKSTLRMAIGAIQYAEVAGEQAKELTDAEEIAVLTKEQRTRIESAETYAAAGRPELAEKESGEATLLARYLPQPLTDDELTAIVDEEVAKVEAELGSKPTMKQMGGLVKAVNARVAGRADGKTVATQVRARLG
nr:GatB/YqeY domain-containing protein [Brooklawnia cerclae]